MPLELTLQRLLNLTTQLRLLTQVSRGEVTKQYHKLPRTGYRVKLEPFVRPEGLTDEDYNNGYNKLYQHLLEETGK